MKRLLIFFTLAFLHLTTNAQEESSAAPPLAIVLGVDCSMTTKNYTVLEQGFYKKIMESLLKIAEKRDVQFAFQSIGNPTDEALQRLLLRGPVLKEPRNLREALLIKKTNETIQIQNIQAVENYLKKLNTIQIKDHINTDIQGFLKKAFTFLNEPTLASSSIKIVLMYTDGIHDVADDKELKLSIPDEIRLIAAGWKNQTYSDQILHFESPDGFDHYLLTFNQ